MLGQIRAGGIISRYCDLVRLMLNRLHSDMNLAAISTHKM
jgi:hypothetical protein